MIGDLCISTEPRPSFSNWATPYNSNNAFSYELQYTPSTPNEPHHLHWATHSPMSYTVYTPSTPNEPRHLHWATHSLMSYTVFIHHLQYSKWATPSPLSHAFSNELHAIYSNWALTSPLSHTISHLSECARCLCEHRLANWVSVRRFLAYTCR